MIPDIIREVGFDFNWSEEKVWRLNYPSEEMRVSNLEWHFSIPFLNSEEEYDLKPVEVIMNPENHKAEFKRAMDADLSHPIDIMKNKGRWLILDGLHRLMKAKLLGMEKVNVRKIPREEIRNITV